MNLVSIDIEGQSKPHVIDIGQLSEEIELEDGTDNQNKENNETTPTNKLEKGGCVPNCLFPLIWFPCIPLCTVI